MADGANVVTTIQSCLSNIPWDSLDSLPDAEKKWFQGGGKEEEEEEEEEEDDNNNMDTDPNVGANTRMSEESREGRGGGNGERDGGDKAEEDAGKSEGKGVEKGGVVDEDREEEDDGSKEGCRGNGNDKRREESSDEEESDPGQNGEKEISTDEDQQFKGTSAVRPSRKSSRKYTLSETSDEEDEGHSSRDGEDEIPADKDQESEGASPMQSSPKSAHRYTRSEISEEEGSHSSENGENEVSTDGGRRFRSTSVVRHPRKSTGVATRNSAAHKPATLIAQKPKHQSARKSARLDGPARPSSSASKAPIWRKNNKRSVSRAARPAARTSLADGDSIFQPIDLTKLDDPTLNHLATPKKHVGPAYCVFGPQGEQFEIKPTSHCQDELKKLLCILNAVTNEYVDGQPLHISRPKDSTFAIFSEKEFDLLHDQAILDTLRTRNIVVTGRMCSPANFDLKSLGKLRLLTRVDTIQDQSIDPGKNFNYNLRNVEGTLLQMHACASIPGDAGKILNALDCPMGNGNLMCNGFTSDLHARWATQRLLDCGANKPLPAEDIRWGLAATSGASHWFHIDSDGFGTYIDVQTGGKLWIIARPKIDGGSRADFARVDILLPPNFDISDPCTAQWDLEAVFLTPGTRLIMRPNTPHAVYTQGHTICHGGHFYATSCLQDTLYSLIHSFVAGSVVTNTEHRASSGLAHREDYVDHMLPLHTMNGVLDLFSICILTETSNILNLQTYDGGMSLEDRKCCVEARHRSRDLLDWFFSRYQLVRAGTVLDGYKDVYLRFLARVVIALVRYKKLATEAKIRQLGRSITTAVENQVDRCFKGVHEYHTAAAYWNGKEVDSFAWPSDAEHIFGVELLSKPKERSGALNGLTTDDEMYEKRQPL
ncbi:hypothetical protein BD779DRAFT_1679429 [Infundibulicybe gibba]|nr:hypothetical protein BD779DRAFT_1679429 [Infundibulicybe gibba]